MVASYSPRVRLAPLTTTASPAIAAAVAVGSTTTSSATRTPSQSHLKPFPWSFLPPELRLNILAHLPISDVKSCSLASHETHSLCVGVLFRVIKLRTLEHLTRFVNDIPTRYRECVRELECCTRPACYDDPYYLDVDVDLGMDVDQFSSYDDQFLDVPSTNSISNSRANVTETLISLLQTTPHLERLALSVGGSPTAGLIPVFESLTRVSKFELANWADEVEQPLSERLAVSLAYALPSLTDLSLTRITRSAQHAHDLLYDSTLLSPYPSAYPNTFPTSNPAIPALEDTAYTSPSTLSYSYSTVPIVVGDEDIVPPSRARELGIRSGELRLPVLLMLRGLRRLKIRDTHMGDPMWCVEEGRVDGEGESEGEVKPKAKHQLAPLEVLDLGSCAHESPAVNEQCTARILRRVPSTIKSFSLSTALPDVRTLVNSKPIEKEHQQQQTDDDSATSPSTSAVVPTHPVLPHLRTLHLTPLVPVSALQTTLAQPTLAESPVHTLSVAFHPDDAGEGCEALVAFLGERGVGVGSGLGGVKGDCSGGSKVGCGQRRRSASVGVGVFATKPSFSSPLTRGCMPSSSSSTSSSSSSTNTNATTQNRPIYYPSLRTLHVDLASTETDTDIPEFSASPTCLSSPFSSSSGPYTPSPYSASSTFSSTSSSYTPNTRNARAMARARAAEERKRSAVRRLKGVCREMGIDAVVKGCVVEEEEEMVQVQEEIMVGVETFVPKVVGCRSRSNSA